MFAKSFITIGRKYHHLSVYRNIGTPLILLAINTVAQVDRVAPMPLFPTYHPEIVPAKFHADCLYDDFGGLVAKLRWALTHREATWRIAEGLRARLARFDWAAVAPLYDEAMERTVGLSN